MWPAGGENPMAMIHNPAAAPPSSGTRLPTLPHSPYLFSGLAAMLDCSGSSLCPCLPLRAATGSSPAAPCHRRAAVGRRQAASSPDFGQRRSWGRRGRRRAWGRRLDGGGAVRGEGDGVDGGRGRVRGDGQMGVAALGDGDERRRWALAASIDLPLAACVVRCGVQESGVVTLDCWAGPLANVVRGIGCWAFLFGLPNTVYSA
ncbi:unnamed protein product [Urochloa humidicola]